MTYSGICEVGIKSNFSSKVSVQLHCVRVWAHDLRISLRAEEEKLKRLTAERKTRDAESVAIGGMLFELTELEAPPIEFDEKLWHAVVDHVTVYHDDRLVYSLKDGTEITIEL